MLTATSAVMLAAVAALAIAFGVTVGTGATLPSWAPFALVLAAFALFQALIVSLTFVFIILGARDSSTFIPLRDYVYFVAEVQQVFPDRSHAVSVSG
jgi:hypothetical protein